MSVSMASPLLSVHRDLTPPVMPDISHVHERLTQLDAQVSEIRSVVLTIDGYVERRNREDKHIRREFEAERSIAERIDASVTVLKEDVNQIKTEIIVVKTEIIQIKNSVSDNDSISHDIAVLRKDVDRLQTNFQTLQFELRYVRSDTKCLRDKLEALRTEMRERFSTISTEISTMKAEISTIKTDIVTIKSDIVTMKTDIVTMKTDISTIKVEMALAKRVHFNSLASTISAPIMAPPKIGEDGKLQNPPKYAPKNVRQFWRLRDKDHHDYLVGLAEFYEVEGHECWHETDDDYGDEPNHLTLVEAIYKYPDSCHQALAAVFGLNYNNIRRISRKYSNKRSSESYGEGSRESSRSRQGSRESSRSHQGSRQGSEKGSGACSNAPQPRAPKRPLEDVEPVEPTSSKAVKQMSAVQISPSFRERLIAPAPPSKGRKSPSLEDHRPYVFWRGPSSELSEGAIARIKESNDSETVLRGIDRGILKVKDDPKYFPPKENPTKVAPEEYPPTIATEILSPEEPLPQTQNVMS